MDHTNERSIKVQLATLKMKHDTQQMQINSMLDQITTVNNTEMNSYEVHLIDADTNSKVDTITIPDKHMLNDITYDTIFKEFASKEKYKDYTHYCIPASADKPMYVIKGDGETFEYDIANNRVSLQNIPSSSEGSINLILLGNIDGVQINDFSNLFENVKTTSNPINVACVNCQHAVDVSNMFNGYTGSDTLTIETNDSLPEHNSITNMSRMYKYAKNGLIIDNVFTKYGSAVSLKDAHIPVDTLIDINIPHAWDISEAFEAKNSDYSVTINGSPKVINSPPVRNATGTITFRTSYESTDIVDLQNAFTDATYTIINFLNGNGNPINSPKQYIKILRIDGAFQNCTRLTGLTVPFDTSNVTSMANVFNRCISLSTLDLDWDDTMNRDVTNMFAEMKNSNITLSNMTFKNVTTGFDTMFGKLLSSDTITVRLKDKSVADKLMNELSKHYDVSSDPLDSNVLIIRGKE